METTKRRVVFKASYWSFEEKDDDNKLYIYIGGHTQDNKTVLIRVDNFKMLVYLELPVKKNVYWKCWNKTTCGHVFNFLKSNMKQDAPISFDMVQKYKLQGKTLVNTMRLIFPTQQSAKKLHYKFARPLAIQGLGMFSGGEFKVHEHNIDPIIKFTTAQRISLSGWIEAIETIPEDEQELTEDDRKFTTADIDMYCNYRDVRPFEMKEYVNVRPKYCGFDIECYSKNHNSKLPDPEILENKIFHIAMIFGQVGDKQDKRKIYALTLHDPLPIDGATVVRCSSEKELLCKFTTIVQEENPDIFIGYNIMKFDWNYMIKRAHVINNYLKFLELSRLIQVRTSIKTTKWESSAYGKQEFSYVDPVGRINEDVLLEVERNFRLPTYKLDYAAGFFLKVTFSDEEKDMFERLGREVGIHLKDFPSKKDLETIKTMIRDIMPIEKCKGIFAKMRDDLLSSIPETIKDFLSKSVEFVKAIDETPDKRSDIIKELLGAHKDEVTPKQLFMLYKFTEEILPLVKGKLLDGEELKAVKLKVIQMMPLRETFGLVRKLRSEVIKAIPTNIETIVRKAFWLTLRYCIWDVVLTIDIAEKLNLWTSMCEFADCTGVPVSYLHTRGQQIRVLASVYHETSRNDIIIPFNAKQDTDQAKYQGAFVVEANPGDYKKVVTLDFNSLYPSMIIAFNICYTTILADDDPTPDEKCHIITWTTHKGCFKAKGCPLDTKKEKVKAVDVVCASYRYRFRKVETLPDGTRINEGLMPKLERFLLGTRKIVKKGMEKLEARSKMNEGKASEKDIEYYKKCGYEIIAKGSLPKEEAELIPLRIIAENAKQNALKTIANSGYGTMGARNGFIPFIPGAGSVTAKGRELILKAIKYVLEKYNYVDAKLVYGDSVTRDTPILCRLNGQIFYLPISDLQDRILSEYNFKSGSRWEPLSEKGFEIWSDKGFTKIKEIIKHYTKKRIYRVVTHTGVVDVTEDHSLLTEDEQVIKPCDVKVGMRLLHSDLPLMSSKYYCDTPTDLGNVHSIEKLGTAINFLFSPPCKTDRDNVVEKIIDLGETEDFVYDIETENHHFAAGIGRLVVHNTDSCMIKMGDNKSLQEVFALGDEISNKTSHYLRCCLLDIPDDYNILCPSENKYYPIQIYPRKKMDELDDEIKIKIHEYDTNPVTLAFENLYSRYVLLSKKRYIAYSVTREGEVKDITKKGVVLSRRDNCFFLRDTYEEIIRAILDDKSESVVYDIIYNRVQKLFTMKVPSKDLVIYTAVKDVMNYAKKEEKKKGRNMVEKVFLDSDGNQFEQPGSPLDSRLVFPNLPQCLLALKMIRRGEEIPPNTRLEYLYLINKEAVHQGDKAEDFTFYRENKNVQGFQPDYLHYVEKQLMKPITELLNVKFPHAELLWIDPETQLKSEIEKMNVLLRSRIERAKNLIDTDKYRVLRGKVRYILESCKKEGANEISKEKHASLVQAALRWLSVDVLNRLYKCFGLMKRKMITKPTKRGVKTYVQNANVMKHILDARTGYSQVVEKFNEIFGESEKSITPKIVFPKSNERRTTRKSDKSTRKRSSNS